MLHFHHFLARIFILIICKSFNLIPIQVLGTWAYLEQEALFARFAFVSFHFVVVFLVIILFDFSSYRTHLGALLTHSYFYS